jgi:hypothetical protein
MKKRSTIMKNLGIKQGSSFGSSFLNFSQQPDSKLDYYITNAMPQMYCYPPNDYKCYWRDVQLSWYMPYDAYTRAQAADGKWYKTFKAANTPGVCTIRRPDQIC